MSSELKQKEMEISEAIELIEQILPEEYPCILWKAWNRIKSQLEAKSGWKETTNEQ
jgi:hypothetical protein